MEGSSSNTKELQARFISWAKENKIYYHPNLNLFATFENGLRGVETTSNIDKGTLLMEIPETAYLSPPILLSPESVKTSIMDADLVQFLQSAEPPISPWLQIVLVIMHELALFEAKKDSNFTHYFSILPKRNELSSILYFNQEEVNALKGTSIENLVSSLDMTNQFDSNVLSILKKNPKWWPESVQNVDAFKYCACLITSRAFHDGENGDGPFLLPGVDLLNHDSNECQTHLVRTDDKKFRIEATRYIGKVFTTYGHLSNAQLLHTYGFLEDDNKFDQVFIPVDIVLQNCQEENPKELFDAKKECLASHGFLPNEHYIISKEDMLPEILLTTIQVFFMDAETFDEYKQDPILLGDFSAEEEEDEDLMVNVFQTLIAIIDAKLATYPTTLRNDLQMLSPKAPKMSENMRNVVKLRLEEKKLLSDLKGQFVEEILEITKSNKEEEPEPKKRPNKSNNNKKRKNDKKRKH